MTEITPHIKVVQHPNPKRRSYHVVREISPGRNGFDFGSESMDMSALFDKTKPSELVKELTKKLENIPGVVDGHFKQYEISIGIGDAFSWKDIGPFVLGEIVKSVYPDIVGGKIEISTSIGWSYYVQPRAFGFFGEDDDGHRVSYQDMVDHQAIDADLGAGRPRLDIENLLGSEALQEAKAKKAAEVVIED